MLYFVFPAFLYMDDFLKMDVFFAVTTLAVAVVTVLFGVALIYAIRILRTFERLMRSVEDEAELVRADINDVRKKVRAEGLKLSALLGLAHKSGKRILKKTLK